MRIHELTEVVGRRDAVSLGTALEQNWNDWGRFERAEAAATTYAERIRRIEDSLLSAICGDQDLVLV